MSRENSTHGSAVGIDFGTTNSSVARLTESGVELVAFGHGDVSSRSILYLEKARRGLLSNTGPTAIERYLSAHRDGLPAGRLIQSLKSYLTSHTLTGTEVFGQSYTLEDLISRMLGDLRLRAEQQFGGPVRRAVVGRPVRFVGAQNDADDAYALGRLRAAFMQAGFESVRFELEPLAAAAAYESRLDHAETILIGDFGGGTSDFSLLRVGAKGSAPVLSESTLTKAVLGNSGLGFAGDAFDARIVRRLVSPALGSESLERGGKGIPAVPAWIYARLERWHHLSFLRTRNVLEILSAAKRRALEPEKIDALLALINEDLGYQLHQAVQRTKLALSTQEEAPFVFAGPDAGTPELRTSVSRAEFEGWIEPELERIAETVDSLLDGAGAGSTAVDRVFLTGGTSFVPAVRRIFESRFPGRVVAGNEFTSVAEGLARIAGGTFTIL